jgi:hypothetical protein
MTNRKMFEPVDRTLRDIKGEEHKDLLLFGGDFAQTLPVVEKGRRADTLQKSFIWEKLKKECHPYSLMQCASSMAIRFNTPCPWIVSRFCLKFSV